MMSQMPKVLFTLLFAVLTQVWAISNSMGTPIGGMGTGYVKFNARTGDFAASGKVPPAASDQVSEFSNKKSSSSGFHLFAGGVSSMKAKTNNEDAKCPLYTANFGKTGNVNFILNAFGPFIPGDSDLNLQLATSPLAFFEVTATNEGAEPVEVAAAMEFANYAGTRNLLGGTNNGELDAASNNQAITFPGTGNTGNAYLAVDCNGATPTYSAGSLGSFASAGTLANGNGNLVGAKCTVPAGGTVKFKFTLAWWRTFVSTKDRYGDGKVDEDNYYYHNFYNTSKEAADFGRQHFDQVSVAVQGMVARIMASNFPEWYRDRLLNNNYPLIHNSVCTKDGRMCYWEGTYPIIGTIDQGEHASVFYTFNWPKNQWHELNYWIRSANAGTKDAKLKGQIHHDFNIAPGTWNDEAHFIAPWDNWDRLDYWWVPNTTDWSDLNSMLIFKAYELMLATGNRDSMVYYFPKVLNTANRILQQCADAGKKLPVKSKSTYDSKGEITPEYASGVALAAFRATEEMAKFVGDDATAQKYHDWYVEAKAQFKSDLFTSNFATGREHSEGDVAGYSWAHYFGFEPIMDADFITTACKRLWQYYNSAPSLREKLGLWHFYTYDHWGGAEIARGVPDTAMMVHKWDYDYYYTAKPEMVFWQTLQKTNSDYGSYMTGPCVWRSYFQMTGYLIDNAHNRLWIRPSIPSVMNETIQNAPLMNPYGWGTLNYSGVANGAQKQAINITFDNPVLVKELVLKNNTGITEPFILINGSNAGLTVTTEDFGLEKNICVALATPLQIGPEGVDIKVYSEPVGIAGKSKLTKMSVLSLRESIIRPGEKIHYSIEKNSPVTMELLRLDGTKIGTIMKSANKTAGEHGFVWNGRTVDGNRVNSSVLILRIVTSSGSVSKKVMTGL